MNFVDSVKIELKAGNGGNGFISFFQDWMQKKPSPDGGNGGNGGSVVFVAKSDLNSLVTLQGRSKIIAPDGGNGLRQKKHGRNGDNVVVEVPVGTLVFNSDKTELIFDFVAPGQLLTLVEGGKGGTGNAFLSSKFISSSENRQIGKLGVKRTVWLDLRFLAHVGLIGLPNVGKTSLLNVLTNSVAKVGNYQFTTLTPNLGVLKETFSGKQIVMADLPGIIENAHKNRGLGNQFLKHAERCRLLIHVFDLSLDFSEIKNNIQLINGELFKYDNSFQTVPQILVGNKADLLPCQKNLSHFLSVSVVSKTGLEKLKKTIVQSFQDNLNLQTVVEKKTSILKKQFKTISYFPGKDISFKKISKNVWRLSGKIFDEFLRKHDINTSTGLNLFNQKMKESKVDLLLKKEGVRKGDLVYLQKFIFYWQD